MARRFKIDFQKLLDGCYPLHIELFVFNWMLQTGRKYSEPPHAWHGYGVDRTIFQYSADNHISRTDMGIDFERTMKLGFFRILCTTPDTTVKKWKDAEGVYIGKHRYFTIPIERPETNIDGTPWFLDIAIKDIYGYYRKPLKKSKFHREYSDRTEPYVKAIKFTTSGNGFSVDFDFTFKEYPGCAWGDGMSQREGESIDNFVFRVHDTFRQLLPQPSK